MSKTLCLLLQACICFAQRETCLDSCKCFKTLEIVQCETDRTFGVYFNDLNSGRYQNYELLVDELIMYKREAYNWFKTIKILGYKKNNKPGSKIFTVTNRSKELIELLKGILSLITGICGIFGFKKVWKERNAIKTKIIGALQTLRRVSTKSGSNGASDANNDQCESDISVDMTSGRLPNITVTRHSLAEGAESIPLSYLTPSASSTPGIETGYVSNDGKSFSA